jgi:HEAT repeat protein
LNGDPDPDVRAAVATALGQLGKPALPAVLKALASEDADLRFHAASALREMGPVGLPAFAQLVERLKDADLDVRMAAASALGQIGDARAVEPLTALIPAGGPRLRRQAIKALGDLGARSKPAVPLLVTALKDPDRGVREAATGALWHVGKPSVTGLIGLLKEKDNDTETRVRAVVVLGLIGKDAEEAVPALTTAVKDKDAYVRLYAIRALGRMGAAAKPAIKALRDARKDEEPKIREAADEALGKISPGG